VTAKLSLIFFTFLLVVLVQPYRAGSYWQNGRSAALAIAVKLSDQAEKRLHSIGESVLVIAYFDGDALPGQGKL